MASLSTTYARWDRFAADSADGAEPAAPVPAAPVASAPALDQAGFVGGPSWEDSRLGARHPRPGRGAPGDWPRGWRRAAAQETLRNGAIPPQLSFLNARS